MQILGESKKYKKNPVWIGILWELLRRKFLQKCRSSHKGRFSGNLCNSHGFPFRS
ncbi:hypothetical protein LEP1GSC120_2275 [Leptospira santarosai str. 200702252]|nr:hypothetical protein LEP1GSC130_1368 [Leptospira santarosai str. 200403458]EMO99067.1 hypothetical protein LEP1GSC120_2275 [Leptospira santarosai str. 200702252]